MEEEDEFGDLYAEAAGVILKDDDASSSSSPYSKKGEEEEGAVGPSDELELFYGQMMITSHNKDCYSDGHDAQTDKGESPRKNNENHQELVDGAHAQLAQMDANSNGNGHNWGDNNTDSDNDSDDLDILVNDDQHQHQHHHHRAEQQQEISEDGSGGGGGRDDEDDDDDDDLVIVTGDEQQPITVVDTEWGEEGLQLPLEGEMSLTAPPLPPTPIRDDRGTGVSALNSHYSQYKYVRRGAAAVSGTISSNSGVVQNQSKPSVFNGGARGPGRNDWCCSGGRGHMQRSFHSGVGMPPWSGGSMSRMQNGFEFTLPPKKTIFDINVDKFEEKRWHHPGVDVSDFFNFDLDEDSWKHYCRQLEQHRLESTMQSKICVYESGRSEQDYDPDLPPELAAAAGLIEVLGENIEHRKDTGSLVGTVLARGRPQFPTGRAIQVEGGLGDRLPSVDVRRSRLRDSDAVIQIVLHDATEDGSAAPINAPETVDNRSLETVDGTSRRDEPGKVSHESEGDQKEFDVRYSLQEIQAAGKWERGTPHVRTHTDGKFVPQNIDGWEMDLHLTCALENQSSWQHVDDLDNETNTETDSRRAVHPYIQFKMLLSSPIKCHVPRSKDTTSSIPLNKDFQLIYCVYSKLRIWKKGLYKAFSTKRGMCIPPWRKFRYVQFKWVGPYHRTSKPAPTNSGTEQGVYNRHCGLFHLPLSVIPLKATEWDASVVHHIEKGNEVTNFNGK